MYVPNWSTILGPYLNEPEVLREMQNYCGPNGGNSEMLLAFSLAHAFRKIEQLQGRIEELEKEKVQNES